MAEKQTPAKKTATTAAKSTSAKPKPAAKATAAKPAAAKSATAKTATAKTAAAKTATKTAASKTPAKAASKAEPKEKVAKAESKDTAAAPRKAGTGDVPFIVGDKVVYPHHGAATIIAVESIAFDGEGQDYYVLEVATDQLTVRVPVAKALDLGVRPVISTNVARKVFATFREEPQEAGSNWSRWYKLLTEKINSGDIFQVAEVVRDLTFAQQVKGISPALKRMLAKARLIIVGELPLHPRHRGRGSDQAARPGPAQGRPSRRILTQV